MKYIVLILSILFGACQSKPIQKEEIKDTENAIDSTSIEIDIPQEDCIPVIIDSTYVVRTNEGKFYGWLPLKYQPDEGAAEGGGTSLGRKLYIVGVEGDWLKVWTLLFRDKEGNYYSDNSNFGCLYIKKEFTGEFEELLVTEEELPVIAQDYSGNLERNISSDTLSFQFISKKEYCEQKESAVSLLVRDTLQIRKRNGEIVLPCLEKMVTFTDVDSDGDNYCEYIYIGQIPQLNVYLIRGRYFESGNYIFIDKDSGETSATFGDFPAVSSDGRYVVDIWGSLYDNSTGFVFSRIINGNSSEVLLCCFFTKWLPFNAAYYKEIDYFWSNDNYLYVKIQSALLSAQIYEDYAAQYMKVKIGLM